MMPMPRGLGTHNSSESRFKKEEDDELDKIVDDILKSGNKEGEVKKQERKMNKYEAINELKNSLDYFVSYSEILQHLYAHYDKLTFLF